MSNMIKKTYIGMSIVLVIIIILFMGWIGLQVSGDKILKNTYINEINVGGLSEKEAKKELEQHYKLENIEVTYLNKKWSINNKDVDLYYDLDKTIERAYSTNRGKSFINNVDKTVKSKFR